MAETEVPQLLSCKRLFSARNTIAAANGSTKAMLKQLAPKDRIPPSPNSSACNASATETAMAAASGPSSSAMSAPPTAWPVVPPGSGTLNIMSKKENAAQMPRKAICSRSSVARTFLMQWTQTGTIATAMTASVCGDR